MAFDGAFLHKIKQELDRMAGARIDKISQPTHSSIVITLRGFSGGNRRLLISAEAAGAKLHFTESRSENPKAAPMFCMLLRKHLGAGKLLRTEQAGLDRVITLVFECRNELGDREELSLYCEMMGRRSNIVLVSAAGKVIDAIKRVDFVTSEVRQLIPGIAYQLPPAQQKLNPLMLEPSQLASEVIRGRELPLSKAIQERLEGLSPVLCREISCRCADGDPTTGELDIGGEQRLAETFTVLLDALAPDGGSPTMVCDEQGKQLEFSIMPLLQYPSAYTQKSYESYSALLDSYYVDRDVAESMRQKAGDLRKQLVVVRDRIQRKLGVQRQELLAAKDREQKREFGDIISTNIYKMSKGDKMLRAVNYFDPDGGEVEIPLNPLQSPSQNAQRYYGDYRKAVTAEAKLTELIEAGEHELEYIETILSELDRATSEAELAAIRDEAIMQGYSRRRSRQKQKPVKLNPHRYISSDGFVILSGRTNLQNDQLTLREAHNYDIWLHTQKLPGSHTIIVCDGAREIPDRTIEEAAIIAACNSAAGHSNAKVPVDYTHVRNVKKPRGAKPGMVIYVDYRTAMVLPDTALEQRLRKE